MNSLAIASVTAVLRQLIQSAVSAHEADEVSNVSVTSVSPGGQGLPTTGVNVYLLQVTPNAAARASDAPTRRSDGTLVHRPRVAFDLHYLLSFHGVEDTLEPQRLLGITTAFLNAQPLLSRGVVTDCLQLVLSGGPAYSFLAGSDLVDQPERVRLTMEELSLESLSKVWSVFFQTRHVLSVMYCVGPVFIEVDEAPTIARPVQVRNIYVRAEGTLRLTAIEPTDADAIIQTGTRIALLGTGLASDDVRVVFGDHEVVLALDDIRPDRIELVMPAAVPAGVSTARVVHRMPMGSPPTPHRGVESNMLAFVLRPRLLTATALAVPGPALTAVRVRLEPAVTARQAVTLILSEAPPGGRSFAFSAASRAPNSPALAEVVVAVRDIPPGTWTVRVLIDGIENAVPSGEVPRTVVSP